MKNIKSYSYFLLFILVLPVLLFRDFTPNNELKYLSIADEALRDGHLFAFYHQGEAYADKPPLYFWFIMLSKWIFGEYHMIVLSLFSIIPALVSIHIMNKWVEEETSRTSRWSATLMLYTSALYIGSALVLRMDMLMCMFILLALYTFYKEYSGKGRPIDSILLPFYIFMAIFSKGPVGFIVPVVSILVFLIVKKEAHHFGQYLGWKQWGILLGLCAIWFGCVFAEGGTAYLNNLLFNQTVNRAVDSFHHKEAFWYYGVTIWYSVAPWSLLYAATIIIALRKKLLTTDKEKFFFTIIASTFVLLSVFSAKLDIYMLPLFPFFTYLTILLLPKMKEKWVAFTVYIPVVALVLAPIVAFAIRNKMEFPYSTFIPIALGLLFMFCLLAFVFLLRKKLYKAINYTSLGILCMLFTGAFALPKFNPSIGLSEMAEKAYEICEEEDIDHYYYYRFRSGENMDVYLHEDAIKISDENSLFKTYEQGDCMIFLKEKDVSRSENIINWLKNVHHEKIGTYYLVYPQSGHLTTTLTGEIDVPAVSQ
ncbi:ArnT family glycosyltransferase [Butyricimonas synergistica]|uniref:ArnT family glycosyltransferase n=1 Tax=Butyricimonas synergistica TaxID=544644 RepID=UPI0009DB1866|nr:glycosyltransferase family 39 protein [Butyricimonas synergistica]